ncbi:MORN repeat protein [Leptospira fainei serovar Hurstbridge str. BUT 6]|uniref:MORN repeat protein n=1 Tax=Leptospira fainei serovar Hurstbridge str. BUT 6 TaxID=1193011 RepID=S3VXK1_9LEPT|nr:MORN repeat protein [Leptospira fainei]EPG72857.1 MORN repeat protein [Leptospira fainei serovar Hurstbridge str. BUT 6]
MNRIYSIAILILITVSCSESTRPEGIPIGAKYDKARNVYYLDEPTRQRLYYENGKLYSDCSIDEAKQFHGFCRTYARSEDRTASEGRYVHGAKVGDWVWYFPDGKIYVKQKFGTLPRRSDSIWLGEEGNEDGPYLRYYSDGTLELQGFYKEGQKSELWQKFFKDGELEYSGYYAKGKKVRTWFYYFPNRTKEAVEVFDNDGNFLSRSLYSPQGKKICEVDSKGASCG